MSPRDAATGPAAEPAAGDRVCAIVVTYHPGAEVPGHVDAILRQAARVIVVDNEATEESRARLAIFADNPAVELVHNSENLGIATALNQGVQRALAAGYEWIATFDQDSVVPEEFFSRLLAAHAAYPGRERVAVLAPLYRDRHLGFIYSSAGPVKEELTGDVPIQVTAASGNLVSAAALQAVGGFREDFFIDCVDFEFCLRCRRAGWLVLEVRRVILDHAMGHYRQIRWLWRRPRINDYDATRRYYQARNLLVLYANFGLFDPRWMARNAWFYGRDLIKLMLFYENRREKLGAIFTGWWHAAAGRRGRWQPGAR
jgi:rhamnosyltransferase